MFELLKTAAISRAVVLTYNYYIYYVCKLETIIVDINWYGLPL